MNPAEVFGQAPLAEAESRRVTIANHRGLHARAAAKFVRLAGQFGCAVEVGCRGVAVSGLSIMGLMMLAAAPGTEIEIRTRGPEAQRALAALAALVEDGFHED